MASDDRPAAFLLGLFPRHYRCDSPQTTNFDRATNVLSIECGVTRASVRELKIDGATITLDADDRAVRFTISAASTLFPMDWLLEQPNRPMPGDSVGWSRRN